MQKNNIIKKALLIIASIIVFVVFICYGNIAMKTLIPSPYRFDTLVDSKIIDVRVDKDSLSSKEIKIILNNYTDDYIGYGSSFYLEYKMLGMWFYIKPKRIDSMNFTMNINVINPTSSEERTINWADCYGSLPKGNYRIIQEVSTNPSKQDEYVYAEFEIK